MKSRFKGFAIALLSVSLIGTSGWAEAKKLGGGGNFGIQKQKNYERKAVAPTPPAAKPASSPASAAPAPAQAAGAASSGASKWLGPLAGLAAGGLLAAMLLGDGFENFAFMDFILLALLAFVAFKLLMRRRRVAQQEADYAYAGPVNAPSQDTARPAQTVQGFKAHTASSGLDVPVIGSGLGESARPVDAPIWFDAESFSQDAMGHFMTVQKAWDEADTGRLAAFMTPTLYGEIVDQLIAREQQENSTVVTDLSCEIEETVQEDDVFIVSLRFSGFVSEEGAEAHAFQEIWHIQRPMDGSGRWQLAGLQQVH